MGSEDVYKRQLSARASFVYSLVWRRGKELMSSVNVLQCKCTHEMLLFARVALFGLYDWCTFQWIGPCPLDKDAAQPPVMESGLPCCKAVSSISRLQNSLHVRLMNEAVA